MPRDGVRSGFDCHLCEQTTGRHLNKIPALNVSSLNFYRMNTKFVRLTVLAAAMLAGCLSSLSAAEASEEYAAMSGKMLKALETGNFEQFIADGNAAWKKLKKGQFDAIAGQLGRRLKAGYETSYLGEFKSGGVQVTLWKIVFKSGDDLLMTMKVKDGKVAAFGLPRV